MNSELLGMSTEELIQWACSRGAIEEKELRKMMPDIEVYCAKMPVSIYDFVEAIVGMSLRGIKGADIGRRLREIADKLAVEGDTDATT